MYSRVYVVVQLFVFKLRPIEVVVVYSITKLKSLIGDALDVIENAAHSSTSVTFQVATCVDV